MQKNIEIPCDMCMKRATAQDALKKRLKIKDIQMNRDGREYFRKICYVHPDTRRIHLQQHCLNCLYVKYGMFKPKAAKKFHWWTFFDCFDCFERTK